MLNEFLKGVLNQLWRVPAFKRSFGESKNLNKLTNCRCWPLGCAQCFNLWIASFLSGTKIESKGDFFHSYFSTMKTKMPNFIILPPRIWFWSDLPLRVRSRNLTVYIRWSFSLPVWSQTLNKIKSGQSHIGSKSFQMYYGSRSDEHAKSDKRGIRGRPVRQI